MLSNVIATYNRKDQLVDHLQALRQQTIGCEAFEVIVVDDGSSDGTPQALRSLVDHMPYALRYYWQPDLGHRVARARNIGIALARYDLIVLNDDDTVPLPDCFAVYAQYGRPGLLLAGVEQHQLETCALRPAQPWMSCITTNEALWKSDFMRAGQFDEGITCYGWEDIDLAFRLAVQGVTITQRMDAVAQHRNAPYTHHPLSADDKAEHGRQAWAYLVQRYEERGMDWNAVVFGVPDAV